jgi:EmrB/QacA subfamily drug resistance transporter
MDSSRSTVKGEEFTTQEKHDMSATESVATAPTVPAGESTAPANAQIVLITLIVVSAVANMPLAMANVALPSIGAYFDASQTQLNLVAVGYSLGLAASVLWLGALGDRHGRKLLLLTGVTLAIPAALIAGFAPSVEILIAGRIFGGLAAGMAFPTCLSLIAALWSGPARTKSIALWAATGGAINACGPLLSGFLLLFLPWNAVFLVVIPVALVAIVMALKCVPAHVKESTEPVDNIGGILSLALVGSLILAINFAPVPNMGTLFLGLAAIALVTLILFVIRQRRVQNPLFDLKVAARPTFWVAAVGGIIVFGSLMGAMFLGQQFMQNVLGYSTVSAGAAILPAAVLMILVAPRSAKLVQERGSRFTLLLSFAAVLIAFLFMLLTWKEGIPYWTVGLAYVFLGIGVGLGGTPSSNSLAASVPVTRVGMASGTADLQRDLGGALLQSIFGALLAAGFAAAMGTAIAAAPDGAQITSNVTSQLEMSYASAETIAQQYPQYATQITAAAKTSFLQGDDYAYIAGVIAVLIGAALIFFKYPKKDEEHTMLAAFHAHDMAAMSAQAPEPAKAAAPTPVPAAGSAKE